MIVFFPYKKRIRSEMLRSLCQKKIKEETYIFPQTFFRLRIFYTEVAILLAVFYFSGFAK